MSAFATAFTQFFTFFTFMFSAMSKFAQSVDNIADVTVAASGTYKDQAFHDQQVAANKRKQELLNAPTTTV